MIAIVDYGVGNLFSLASSLSYLGLENRVTRSEADLAAASRIILPGVGAFGDAMEKLTATGLVPALKREAAAGKPLLGICLGMQMLFDESDEFGIHAGLGLIPGRVEKIPAEAADGTPQRVPNIGWCPLYPAGLPGAGTAGYAAAPADFRGTSLAGLQVGEECYFVHSYEAKPAQPADRLADTVYGGRRICAAAQRGSVLGTQFHPEKSGPAGLSIVEAWLHEAESVR